MESSVDILPSKTGQLTKTKANSHDVRNSSDAAPVTPNHVPNEVHNTSNTTDPRSDTTEPLTPPDVGHSVDSPSVVALPLSPALPLSSRACREIEMKNNLRLAEAMKEEEVVAGFSFFTFSSQNDIEEYTRLITPIPDTPPPSPPPIEEKKKRTRRRVNKPKKTVVIATPSENNIYKEKLCDDEIHDKEDNSAPDSIIKTEKTKDIDAKSEQNLYCNENPLEDLNCDISIQIKKEPVDIHATKPVVADSDDKKKSSSKCYEFSGLKKRYDEQRKEEEKKSVQRLELRLLEARDHVERNAIPRTEKSGAIETPLNYKTQSSSAVRPSTVPVESAKAHKDNSSSATTTMTSTTTTDARRTKEREPNPTLAQNLCKEPLKTEPMIQRSASSDQHVQAMKTSHPIDAAMSMPIMGMPSFPKNIDPKTLSNLMNRDKHSYAQQLQQFIANTEMMRPPLGIPGVPLHGMAGLPVANIPGVGIPGIPPIPGIPVLPGLAAGVPGVAVPSIGVPGVPVVACVPCVPGGVPGVGVPRVGVPGQSGVAVPGLIPSTGNSTTYVQPGAELHQHHHQHTHQHVCSGGHSQNTPCPNTLTKSTTTVPTFPDTNKFMKYESIPGYRSQPTGPSSLHGAFQPKAPVPMHTHLSSAAGAAAAPPSTLINGNTPWNTNNKSKWGDAHVRIAKLIQREAKRLKEPKKSLSKDKPTTAEQLQSTTPTTTPTAAMMNDPYLPFQMQTGKRFIAPLPPNMHNSSAFGGLYSSEHAAWNSKYQMNLPPNMNPSPRNNMDITMKRERDVRDARRNERPLSRQAPVHIALPPTPSPTPLSRFPTKDGGPPPSKRLKPDADYIRHLHNKTPSSSSPSSSSHHQEKLGRKSVDPSLLMAEVAHSSRMPMLPMDARQLASLQSAGMDRTFNPLNLSASMNAAVAARMNIAPPASLIDKLKMTRPEDAPMFPTFLGLTPPPRVPSTSSSSGLSSALLPPPPLSAASIMSGTSKPAMESSHPQYHMMPQLTPSLHPVATQHSSLPMGALHPLGSSAGIPSMPPSLMSSLGGGVPSAAQLSALQMNIPLQFPVGWDTNTLYALQQQQQQHQQQQQQQQLLQHLNNPNAFRHLQMMQARSSDQIYRDQQLMASYESARATSSRTRPSQ